jgi:steroid delta-isomerase-like uncharacterized protein
MPAKTTDAIAANKAMVRRRFRELDKKNFSILDELFDRKYVLHCPGIPTSMTLGTTRQFYEQLYTAFPDLRHTIVEQISAGNKVVTRWTARGTHRGPWMGVQKTGKRISLAGINIYTIRRGKFVESRVNWDLLGLMQQLGAVSVRLAAPERTAGG